MGRSAAALLGAAMLVACEGDVEIIGQCTAETDIATLPLAPGDRLLSVGLLDGHVLVMTDRAIGPTATEWPADGNALYAQWFDPSFAPEGAPILLGWNTFNFFASQWVRIGDALEAQVWAEPVPGMMVPSDDLLVHLWRVPLPSSGPPTYERVTLPIPSPEPGFGVIHISSASYPDISEIAPAVAIAGEPWFFLISTPRRCSPALSPSIPRVFAITRTDGGSPLEWQSDICSRDDFVQFASNPWPVPLGPDEFGLLFRPDFDGIGFVHWVRFHSDRSVVAGPVRVGELSPFSSSWGAQPRAAVAGDRIVFTETAQVLDDCHVLRVMNVDGSDARTAPWQMPCVRDNRRDSIGATVYCRLNRFQDVFTTGNLATLVYSDVASGDPVCDSARVPSRIVSHIITRDGRRGSEPLVLSDEAAEPDGWFRAAADSDQFVAVWLDAIGVRARRARCGRRP